MVSRLAASFTILDHTRLGIFGVKTGSQHWGMCISREWKNHVNVGHVSIRDVNLRMTSTLAVTSSDHSQCQHRKVGLA